MDAIYIYLKKNKDNNIVVVPKRAEQKYDKELVQLILSIGIPNEYVFIACQYYKEDNIPLNVLQQKLKQWILYIKNRNKDVININKLTFKQFDNILRTAIQKAMKPNPIYDDGTIFMGEFKMKEDALLYPIPNNWCTNNFSSKFNQYTQDGYRLFIIENKTLDEPLKYVCVSIFMGNIKYWNTEGYSLFEELRGEYNIIDNEHQKYQATLPKEIISYLYDIATSQTLVV